MEERINNLVALAIPIYYQAEGTRPKDCMAKILYKEQQRAIRTVQIWNEISEIIRLNKSAEPQEITRAIDDYFNHYFENHDNK